LSSIEFLTLESLLSYGKTHLHQQVENYKEHAI